MQRDEHLMLNKLDIDDVMFYVELGEGRIINLQTFGYDVCTYCLRQWRRGEDIPMCLDIYNNYGVPCRPYPIIDPDAVLVDVNYECEVPGD